MGKVMAFEVAPAPFDGIEFRCALMTTFVSARPDAQVRAALVPFHAARFWEGGIGGEGR